MRPIQAPIRSTDSGPLVVDLIQGLLVLIDRRILRPLDAPQRPTADELESLVSGARGELETGTFGGSTHQLVVYLRASQGLGDAGDVDGATAARMNELLRLLGALPVGGHTEMEDIVLRVRLISGNSMDVIYEDRDTGSEAEVIDRIVATLAEDSGVLRCRHGDRLLVLYARGVAAIEVRPRGAVL
jgi:hypothetical protein